ncbi:MAG: 4-alpha-glucanotransferase [Eubacteriaceae bacterium]|nr:4-alpha-glucanotransferase [Eubacteriaceae bacterium]
MRAYHNSRLSEYRNPFGAIIVNGTVSLSIDIFEEEIAEVVLRTWIDGIGEELYPMSEENLGDRVRYTCNLKCRMTALYWYSFRIRRLDGSYMYYGAKPGRTGGEGELSFCNPPSFQITCYKERKLPDWYKNAIVYQIFPDRFYRGEGFDAEKLALADENHRGPGRILNEDWSKLPGYDKDDNGRIRNWDFYGGTLNGIREKLDYLESIGITAIYLNPIFEAASNHRYDTGDYSKIDSLLGTEEDFEDLCKDAEAKGISIILDGVFNHTGCDSKYFNRYGNYPDKGACQGTDSPYYDWFSFNEDGTYDCWWGVDDLPNVRENSESYRNFIFGGKDSVVRKWLRLGAKGWRLDVADELPDDFIAGIKDAVVAEKGDDGLLMGEVWEDASNKISYSQLRRYFLGEELDCVMNYPFRDGIEQFIIGNISAYDLTERLMSLYENYPRENFYGNLNLLGSHDRMRVLTLFGNTPQEYTLSDWDRKNYRMNEGQKSLALGRLWLAVLTQMAMPGVPCIYYGDEAGVEGYSDPYNRATFPWGNEDENAGNIYRNATILRKQYPVLTHGDFQPVAFNDDVFGFYRRSEGESMLLLINRSLSDTYNLRIKAEGEATDVVAWGPLPADEEGYISVHMRQTGSSLIHFSRQSKLAKPMEKGSGVLAHITSIPGGTLGEPAKNFIDFLAEAGQKYWQILPLNPTDAFGSPYSGQSAFAGNFSLTGLSHKEIKTRFMAMSADEKKDFERFINENSNWLPGYAMFCVLKKKYDGAGMQQWPKKYRKYTEVLYKDAEMAKDAKLYMYEQFVFQKMWDEVREYAHSKGVMIIGDMPMYVAADSADVWTHPEMFKIDENGYPSSQAGVPPDYFSADGQLWGNPIYKWDAMKADGYTWWKNRFSRCMALYDYTRLDHFRGFEAFWEIPAGEKAMNGHWCVGGGTEFFKVCHESLGNLPFMAEDLGTITPGVNALLEVTGFPGVDVMQFADTDPLEGYNPPAGKIAYSGTHDNATLKGWAEGRYGQDVLDRLKENLYASSAEIVIMPLQDVLGLGDEARMNVPGVAFGNWSWRAEENALKGVAEQLKSLTEKYGRM